MVEPTYGGRLLKLLREELKLTQEEVALETGMIAARTISHIETGRSRYPKRETIENLLECYEADFNRIQEVLKSFGFLPAYPLPNADDVAAVMASVQPILDVAPVPAYVVDYISRLHGWGNLFVKLSGLDREVLATLKGQPPWKVHYDERMARETALSPHLLEDIRQLRQRMVVYVGEPWFDAFIEECGEPFLTYWHAAGEVIREEPSPVVSFAARLLTPVAFHLPDIPQVLQFFANEERLNNDDRFRLIYLMPADVPTMQWVVAAQQS